MKKIAFVLLVALCAFASCKKDDKTVFEKTADERLKEKLDAYQAQLAGAANGWKGLIVTGTGSVHSFYFKFTEINRVSMLSDFDSTSAVTLKESSFRLKALQQPSLIFDTYSYLHVLADPDPTVNGGELGSGLLSDFEFYFDSTSADTVKLVGRVNGSHLTLVKATEAEATAFNSGQLAAGLVINKILTYFKRLVIGTNQYDLNINPVDRKIIFRWVDGSGNLQTFTTSFYYIAGGIQFTTPLVNGSQTVTGFTDMVWNPATQSISTVAGNAVSSITGVVVPVKVDVGAPKRWWDYAIAHDNSYWISPNGFHVNGVDDAFGLRNFTSNGLKYYFLLYWPEYDPGNDAFAPIFLNAAQTGLTLLYATAPKPTFTSDGRLVLTQLGNYGSYPAGGPAGNSKALLYNPSGWYFVQLSETKYDMVSAADGKSWITWEF